MRVLLGTLVTTLVLFEHTSLAIRAWLAIALAAMAVGGLSQILNHWSWAAVIVELLVCTVAVATTGGPQSVLAPLLLAPAMPVGVVGGILLGTVSPVVGVLILVLAHAVSGGPPAWVAFVSDSGQWAGLAVLLGFLGSWADRLVLDAKSRPDYATAHRLLSELRAVTRRLPSGLDSRAIAAHLLDELREILPYAEGTVSLRRSADQLSPIAHRGGPPPGPAQPAAPDDAAAMHKRTMKAIDLPLTAGDREIGVVTLRSDVSFPSAQLLSATKMLARMAAQLEAGLLFDEVRELATVEERRRLARNIHDGIAQELVSVSYALDNALQAPDRTLMAEQIDGARGELRRILSELRLSIYDLRSDVRSSVSLATALSSYVHSIGRDWGLTIHVSATESKGRLSAECESELLRIAQEALTNARKHAAADNIRVTLSVEAPHAWLRIEDDGTGFANPHSAKSFGVHIMRERATRIGATFRVAPRPGRGTVVEVILGHPDSLSQVGVPAQPDPTVVVTA
ncbi:MAG: hypothetical protein QOJ71_732 [Actinomycetota bacterium]|nr:hypothetical protein [Actinomycetota bacterium]